MKLKLEKINLSPKTLEEAAEVIGQLVGIIIELKKENDSLHDQLNNNSNNSSLPPSQDKKKKKKSKAKTGRNRGGQLGHKVWKRPLVASEEVDSIIDCKPEVMCACGGSIVLSDKKQIHQVYEIPLARYEITEFRIYRGHCEDCRLPYKGQLPAGVSWKGFGPRTQAMLSLLTSKYRLSKRLVQSWFQDVYSMPICLGSVSNIEHSVSQSLASIHKEVNAAVQTAKVVHIDETGYKEGYKSGWVWVVSASQLTYFLLNKSRGKKVAKELIGDYQGRVMVTDRYAAYNYLPSDNHQICWAHLKRDFQKIADRGGQSWRIGQQLLKTYRQLFDFWKTQYQHEISFPKKQKRRLNYLKNKLLRWLTTGVHCEHDRTVRTCKNILEWQHSLWHFFRSKEIPPTNNHAERQLRPLVISKKLTFGTQSNRGSRFIERIFTVVTSCKQQNRDVYAFIIEALHNHFSRIPPPSLLPLISA